MLTDYTPGVPLPGSRVIIEDARVDEPPSLTELHAVIDDLQATIRGMEATIRTCRQRIATLIEANADLAAKLALAEFEVAELRKAVQS